MKKRYKVTLNTTAEVTVVITADSEEDALEQIKDENPNSFNWHMYTPYDGWDIDEVE